MKYLRVVLHTLVTILIYEGAKALMSKRLGDEFKLDGTKKDDINVKNQIYELKSQLPIIIEIAKMKSAYQRERLTALRKEGFKEEQALEIIKAERTPFDQ